MTDVQWLLQRNHPNIGSIREIERILRDEGLDVFEVDLAPRTVEIPPVEGLDDARPTICYGPSFVPRALGRPDLDPGIFFDTHAFRWSSFAANWQGLMLSDGYPMTVDEAIEANFATVFARPDADSKAFDGALYQHRGLEETLRSAQARGLLSDEDLVVLARPVAVEAEWRTFVVGGEVVAASSYRKDRRATIDEFVPYAVTDLAEQAAAIWSPAEVFCLDVAKSGDRYGVVEANCFAASRFYGADASAILTSVSRFVEGRSDAPKP
ncbi:ATP-grasp domain-containing protein [Rhizobium leguminosarum]|uniref:ATP-grasp domain-containing protein n=1 Tax=Rhizobium leguminosarum TaxID=384 RepID=UPI002E0E3863|nr:ATP-grasp domain-containing protein [Rhizobium leguminosarum]